MYLQNTKCHHFYIMAEKFLIDPVLAPKRKLVSFS